MNYRLELLDSKKFEELTNTICQNILGTGVIAFSDGKDGGRDGKFIGTAEKYPSTLSPWKGKFIIQSKITSNPIASCSDIDFENTILKIEVPKIINLKSNKEVDNYLIFTNRKFTGVKGERLLANIKKEVKLENVQIIGLETLNLLLNSHKDIVKLFELDKHHIPFDFSDEEIKEIILEFKRKLPEILKDITTKVQMVKYNFDKIEIEVKNEKNRLSKIYYNNEILSRSLMDFDKIRYFLEDEINFEFKECYFDIVSELSSLITLKRDNFGVFEEIFIFIYQKVADGSKELKGSKRHLLTLLHYMYMNCEIGQK